jgi:hypothetical protein
MFSKKHAGLTIRIPFFRAACISPRVFLEPALRIIRDLPAILIGFYRPTGKFRGFNLAAQNNLLISPGCVNVLEKQLNHEIRQAHEGSPRAKLVFGFPFRVVCVFRG